MLWSGRLYECDLKRVKGYTFTAGSQFKRRQEVLRCDWKRSRGEDASSRTDGISAEMIRIVQTA